MKRKCLSRLVASVLAGVMVIGMMTGCGEKQVQQGEVKESSATKETTTTPSESQTAQEPEELTYPVDTDVELSFYLTRRGLMKSSAYVDYNSTPFYKGLSEKTGIAIDWQTHAEGADPKAAYNLLLQETKLPNIIWSDYGASPTAAAELYEAGLIYDLTEYLPTYAPDYWKWLNENESSKKGATTEDGKILAFYMARESNFNITYQGPIIRQDWLDECGLKAPVTLEDWENVLRIFKEKYNANFGVGPHFITKAGIGSGVGAFTSLSLKYYVEDGQIKCANTQEEWKELLVVLNRWYDEGLLNSDFATEDNNTLRAKALNNEVGIIYNAMSQLTAYINDAEAGGTGAKWVGFSYPRTEAGAPTVSIQTDSQLIGLTYGAVITTSSTEEELIAAIKLLNYGYSEEGVKYWNFGVEGQTYTVDKDGTYQFTELITGDERGLLEAMYDYTGTYSAGPAIQMADLVKAKNDATSVDAVNIWTENTIAEQYLCPPYQRTAEEQELYSDINTQLTTYVSEMALKFVTGDEPLDNFDKFVEQLDALGLQKLLASEQAAYDRYMK